MIYSYVRSVNAPTTKVQKGVCLYLEQESKVWPINGSKQPARQRLWPGVPHKDFEFLAPNEVLTSCLND